MPKCKYCDQTFEWGRSEDRWVPLIPVKDHDGFDRTYRDEDGELRAMHHLVCTHSGVPAVNITKLPRKVLAKDAVKAVRWSEPDEDGVIVPLSDEPPKKPFSLFKRRKSKEHA